MAGLSDHITELNQNYNDLGDDLLLLEAAAIASGMDNRLPEGRLASSLSHTIENAKHHMEDIRFLTDIIFREVQAHRS